MVQSLDKDTLEWRGPVPVAPQFDDVYYSVENGLAETNFVFLGGIGAPEIWANRNRFVIAETGFGTGLNFLATYKMWLESGAKGRLTYISVESFPLSIASLEKAHSFFPELQSLAQKLREAWPAPSPGFHPRFFENGQIELLLLFGDATSCYADLNAEVDAWFLDGFAPAKNPEMWSEALFDQISRLAKPNAHFATFTAAGFVKRALAARGFNVQKTKGFGRKRERLVGQMTPSHTSMPSSSGAEWASLPKSSDGSVAIIGAGVAGRALAAALARKGMTPTLIAGSGTAASAVHAAILAPGFQVGTQPTTPFATAGFCHACWLPAYRRAWASTRGIELCAKDDTEKTRLNRVLDTLNWDESWARASGEGLFYPRSGSLDTSQALNALYASDQLLHLNIDTVNKTTEGWRLRAGTWQQEFANLVVAAGLHSSVLIPGGANLGLTASAGQIETISTDRWMFGDKNLAASGYVTANVDGLHTLGSTFGRLDGAVMSAPVVTLSNRQEVLEKIHAEFGFEVSEQDIHSSWAGIRASTSDHTPVIGPVPDWRAAKQQYLPLAKDARLTGLGPMPYQKGLYVLAGFGSKGYQQAPYAAEYLAALITGTPLPMAQSTARYVHPARALVRKIIKHSS